MIDVPPALGRAGFARLVVVLAALLGMLAIQNTHCTAGSAMAMEPSMSATASPGAADDCGAMHQAIDATAQSHQQEAIAGADAGFAVSTHHASPMLPCDISMACLAIFLALMTVVAIALTLLGRIRAAPSRTLRGLRPVPAVPRPPSLTELCILRT